MIQTGRAQQIPKSSKNTYKMLSIINVGNSSRVLCETVRELTLRVASSSLSQADDALAEKTQLLNAKLENLVRVLDMEGDEKTDAISEKQEKELSNRVEKVRRKRRSCSSSL